MDSTWHRIQENYNINNNVTKLHEITDCYLLPYHMHQIQSQKILVFPQEAGDAGSFHKLLAPFHIHETAYNSCPKHPPKILLFIKKLF